MTICCNCHIEMSCHRNGVVAVFGEAHCYRGDAYQCPKCGSRTLVASNTPTYEPDVVADLRGTDRLLLMNEEKPQRHAKAK